MVIEHPAFGVLLILVIIFEVIYIILDSQEHFVYFRDFIDAIILLTFILCAYFIYHLLKAKRETPIRAAPPVVEIQA